MCNIHLSVSSHYLAWSWVCSHNFTIILRFEITTGNPHLIFTCSEAKKYSQGEDSGLKRRASTFPLGSWFHLANSDRWQVWWRVLLRRDRPRVQLSEILKFVQFGGHKKKCTESCCMKAACFCDMYSLPISFDSNMAVIHDCTDYI